MTKILPVAALTMMLVALSGQAFARTGAPDARHNRQVTDLYASGAFDQMTAPTAAEINTHRYEGGPKSND